MRPRRTVQLTPAGWTVSGTSFFTANEDLAEKVRDELDVVDPLPCPHDADTEEIGSGAGPILVRCADCGEQVEP